MGRRPGLGEEAAEDPGLDPGLDGVAVEPDLVLPERERLAGSHPQLELDEVERSAPDRDHQLGHGVLHLETGVHLQEVERAGPPVRLGVEEELDGARVDVAHLARQRHGGRGDLLALLRGDRRRRCLLEDLLVATLGRAVTLEEVHDVAVVVAEHLHLDVAAGLDVLLDEHGVVAEGCLRLAAGGGEGLVVLVGRADDPHPLAAPTRRGLGRTGRSNEATSAPASYDGTTATPAFSATARAASLRPICSITWALGPTSLRPAASTARAKAARSERKP